MPPSGPFQEVGAFKYGHTRFREGACDLTPSMYLWCFATLVVNSCLLITMSSCLFTSNCLVLSKYWVRNLKYLTLKHNWQGHIRAGLQRRTLRTLRTKHQWPKRRSETVSLSDNCNVVTSGPKLKHYFLRITQVLVIYLCVCHWWKTTIDRRLGGRHSQKRCHSEWHPCWYLLTRIKNLIPLDIQQIAN